MNTEQSERTEGQGKPSDAELVQQWAEAADAAPSVEHLNHLREQADEAQLTADLARAEYEGAVADRALVYGFVRVADETSLTPRRLHMWAREHRADRPNLSQIPMGAMAREERRIAKTEAEIAALEQLKAKRDEHLARLSTIKEAQNR